MKTSFELQYELKDVTALADSNPTSSDNIAFGNLTLLKQDNKPSDYMTMENDFSLLDGSFAELPDNPQNVAFFLNSVSNDTGLFTNNPVLTLTFTENHSSVGITFYFLERFPLQMKITWYSSNGNRITQKYFSVDKLVYFADCNVEEYQKIRIEFTKTEPFSRVKVNKIEYGLDVVYSENEVKSATLTEEADIISDKITVNEMDVSIVDRYNDFELGNANALHNYLQKLQKADCYEYLDGVKNYLGRFYLKSFSTDKKLVKMSVVSILDIMDGYTFYKGKIYNGEKAGTVLDEIFATCGINDYTVDMETRNTPVYGTIGLVTCRKALREVMFATSSIATSARSTGIKIEKKSIGITGIIGTDRKFSTKAVKRDYVSGISVEFYTYTAADKTSKIVTGVYPVGDNLITFKSPHTTITATKGTIKKQGNYYCILTMTEEAESTINGVKMNGTKISSTAKNEVKSVEIESEKKYSGTLFNYDTATIKAREILDYWQNELEVSAKFVNQLDNVGNMEIVKNTIPKFTDYIAQNVKMSTDCVGGFVSNATFIGTYNKLTEDNYTAEFYAGERSLI